MVLDSVNSFIDNLKTKVSNPFFGTLIAVWAVRNWNLIYGVFIFDEDCKMNDKFEFVRSHFKDKHFFNELWTNIAITFGLLFLGYLLLIISRFFANLVEHRITPNINRIAASKLVANKDILTELETQLLQKSNDLINERKLVNELELQLVEIRGRIDVATNEKNLATSKLGEQSKQNRENKRSIEFLESNKNILTEDLNESRKMNSDIRDLSERCIKLNSEENISFNHIDCFLNLWSFNKVNDFSNLISEFDSGTKKFKASETNNNLLKILNDYKIITASLNLEEKSTIVTYTENGEEFAKLFFKIKKVLTSPSLPW